MVVGEILKYLSCKRSNTTLSFYETGLVMFSEKHNNINAVLFSVTEVSLNKPNIGKKIKVMSGILSLIFDKNLKKHILLAFYYFLIYYNGNRTERMGFFIRHKP